MPRCAIQVPVSNDSTHDIPLTCTGRTPGSWVGGGVLALLVVGAGLVGGMLGAPRGAEAQGGAGGGAVPALPAVSRIATVDVFAVVERVWLSDANMAARTALAETTNTQLDDLNKKMEAMRTRAEGLGQDSPELAALAEEFQRVQGEAQQRQQQGNIEMERVSTLQLGEAYQIVMAQARTLAAELGYTHVLASKTGELAFRSTTMNGALQELLARPVVVASEADDITTRLLDKFPVPAALAPGANPGAAPAPLTDPVPGSQGEADAGAGSGATSPSQPR